jgi:uncharacterized membrane protein (DUF485 family)
MIYGLSEIEFVGLILGVVLLLAATVLAILYSVWRRAVYDFQETQRDRSEQMEEIWDRFRLRRD